MKNRLKFITISALVALSISTLSGMFVTTRRQRPMPLKQPQSKNLNQSNNLIIILNPESDDYDDPTLESVFIDALLEKAAPIIATKDILIDFYKHKDNYSELLLSKTDFSNKNWSCYAPKTSELILLIPKNPALKNNTSNILLQFSIESLDHLDYSTLDGLIDHLQKNNAPTQDLVTSLASIFPQSGKNDDSANSWNIYLAGHGMPAMNKDTLNKTLTNLEHELNKDQESFNQAWNQFGNPAADLETKNLQSNITLIKKDIKKLTSYKDSSSRLSDSTIIHDTAQVAGLNLKDFERLISIFNTKIKTSFLHYSVCYSGDYTQTLINDILTKLNVNFIISTQGINEINMSDDSLYPSTQVGYTNTVVAHRKFTQFFLMLNNFFNDPKQFVNSNKNDKIDPLAKIIKNVLSSDPADQNQPLIRIPKVGTFNALSADKSVKIITNSLAKALELENKPLSLSDSSTSVIIYPKKLIVSLNMQNQRIILPVTSSEEKLPVYIFEKINTNIPLKLFLTNIITPNLSAIKKIIIIKNLSCAGQNINNMIIQFIQTVPFYGNHQIDFTILFDTNDKAYAISKSTSNLLEDFDQKPLAQQITQQELVDFAKKLLPNVNINNEIQLSDIIKQIDKSPKIEQQKDVKKAIANQIIKQKIIKESTVSKKLPKQPIKGNESNWLSNFLPDISNWWSKKSYSQTKE